MENTQPQTDPRSGEPFSQIPVCDENFVDLYQRLRRLARKYIGERSGTDEIQPTALVHDAYVKLKKAKGLDDASKTKYFAYAATAMRQILVGHYRKYSAIKRGGNLTRVELDENKTFSIRRGEDVLALEDALVQLQEIDELRARIVEMRFYGGMTMKEIAEATNLSESTIKNKWAATRAWLRKELTY